MVKNIRAHILDLEKNKHFNPHMQAASNMYGKASFAWQRVLYCDPERREYYAYEIINKFIPAFNIVREPVTPSIWFDSIKIKPELRQIYRDLDAEDKKWRRIERFLLEVTKGS